jgi:AcrR family transcriptional regulator
MPRSGAANAADKPKRGRGRPAEPGLREERRREIVRSAYAVLTERGYERTSISDIARHAKVGQGTVYRYFDSKRDLLDHVFDYAVAKTVRALDVDSATATGATVHETVLGLIDVFGGRLFDLVDRDPAILRLITVESSAIDPELRHRVIGLVAAMDAELTKRFQASAPEPSGTAAPDSFGLVGRLVIGMIGPGIAMSIDGETAHDRRALVLSTAIAIADRGLLDDADDTQDGHA